MVETPVSILQKIWGYPGFRGSQSEVIDTVLKGRDAIALMPTGGGKSLCFQVPGLLREGICLVISPLVALMEDQLSGLKSRNIKALGLYGRLSEDELLRRLDNAAFGNYRFLYLSPERLMQDLVIRHLEALPVNLIAVDEAHCISQWGYDFRPAYLECRRLRELFPKVPILALTATAPPRVIEDIRQNLGLTEAVLFRDPMERPELTYTVDIGEDKRYRLERNLREYPGSAIVYVRTRRATGAIAEYLESRGVQVGAYHGGLSAEAKTRALKAWVSGKLRVMVATNAFGMGIDNADVRLVVHYDIPETPEHYFQEAGRAGRDGHPARAVLLASPGDDRSTRSYFLDNLPDAKAVARVYRKLNAYFRIPYGETPEAPLPFRFETFCQTYRLPAAQTFNALEILDRQGVIAMHQVYRSVLKMRFLPKREALWRYLETYPELRHPVQTLLRSYGGLFDFETAVVPNRVAGKIGIPESAFLELIRRMEKDGMLEMTLNEGDMEVHYLQPREDDRTVHAFGRAVDQRRRQRTEKVEVMIAYAFGTQMCRQSRLLRYFGERNPSLCGRCDVCLGGAAGVPVPELRARILRELLGGPKTSRELHQAGCRPETEMLFCLQDLLEEGKLRLGDRNEYILTIT